MNRVLINEVAQDFTNKFMLKTRAVLFDCDGTLVDTEDQTIASINYAMKKINYDMVSPAIIRNLFGPGADIILLQLTRNEQRAAEAFEYFIEHQKHVASSMRVYAGIRDLLDYLKSKNIPLGVVTGRHSRDLDIVLKAHELKDYFDVIISDNMLRNPKPDPEGILLAAEKLDLSPEFIYYTGDMKTDIEASKNARVKSIAALWDKRVDPMAMALEKPWLIAAHPSEIRTRFDQEF